MKKSLLNALVISILVLTFIPAGFVFATPPVQCLPTIEFELDASDGSLASGQVIDNEFAAYGVTVSTSHGDSHPAIIFDTANPTGNDDDLGTPNQAFGGPGVGSGGGPGAGANMFPLGQVLIISNVAKPGGGGNVSDPNDFAGGGSIFFTFDQARHVHEVHILDIDGNESAGSVKAYSDVNGNNQIKSVNMQGLGNNSFQVVTVNADGVRLLEVKFPSSGSVPAIVFCEPDPTAVELSSFDASSNGNAVQLNWETANEIDLLGFNIYRAESADGQRFRLNGSLIAAQSPGSPTGASYQFVDATARPGVTYHYWVEGLETTGGTTFHGPVSAQTEVLRRLLPSRVRLAPQAPIIRNK